MDLIEAYRKTIEDDNAYRQKMMERACTVMPTLPAEPAKVSFSIGYEPYITFPYDRKLMPVIEAAMLKQGWEISHVVTEQDCTEWWNSPRTTYIKQDGDHNYCRVTIEYNDNVDGAVCKRRELGKVAQTKMITAYDFACPEA
jgi:hypothetical protein